MRIISRIVWLEEFLQHVKLELIRRQPLPSLQHEKMAQPFLRVKPLATCWPYRLKEEMVLNCKSLWQIFLCTFLVRTGNPQPSTLLAPTKVPSTVGQSMDLLLVLKFDRGIHDISCSLIPFVSCSFVHCYDIFAPFVGNDRPTMEWPTRSKIALGAAKGLAHLHED